MQPTVLIRLTRMVDVLINFVACFKFIKINHALRFLIALFAFFIGTLQAQTRWKILYHVEEHDAYISGVFERTKKNEASVWVLLNLKEPIDPEGKIKSVLSHRLYDCKKDRFTFLRAEFYSERYGEGILLKAEDSPYPWTFFEPNSHAKLIQRTICSSLY